MGRNKTYAACRHILLPSDEDLMSIQEESTGLGVEDAEPTSFAHLCICADFHDVAPFTIEKPQAW